MADNGSYYESLTRIGAVKRIYPYFERVFHYRSVDIVVKYKRSSDGQTLEESASFVGPDGNPDYFFDYHINYAGIFVKKTYPDGSVQRTRKLPDHWTRGTKPILPVVYKKIEADKEIHDLLQKLPENIRSVFGLI